MTGTKLVFTNKLDRVFHETYKTLCRNPTFLTEFPCGIVFANQTTVNKFVSRFKVFGVLSREVRFGRQSHNFKHSQNNVFGTVLVS